MHVAAVVAGALLVVVVLWEAFETLVLPRRVDRRLRLTRLYFRGLWRLWRVVGRGHGGPRRESYLSIYAPLSLLVLFGVWAVGVIVGFALMGWSLRLPVVSDAGTGLEAYAGGNVREAFQVSHTTVHRWLREHEIER